jgi:hypothetical protein
MNIPNGFSKLNRRFLVLAAFLALPVFVLIRPNPTQAGERIQAPTASREVKTFFDKYMYRFFEDWPDHQNPAIFIKAHAGEIAPLFIEAAKNGPTAEDLVSHNLDKLKGKEKKRFLGTYRSRAFSGLGMAATPEAIKTLREFATDDNNSIRPDARYNLHRAGVAE